jgi:hypothetical protein
MKLNPKIWLLVPFISTSSLRSESDQISSNDSNYLRHSLTVPIPGEIIDNDEIIYFEADITGDDVPEIFYSRASFRDGRQGNIWSVYQKENGDELQLRGEVTFSDNVFTPEIWSKNKNTHGFYTFGPGGAGKGILTFYAIEGNRLIVLESRKIEPNGADKIEFDDLFAAQLKGESPKLDLKRTTLPKQQGTSTPENVLGAEPEIQDTTRAPKPSPVMQPPAPKRAPNANQSPALGDEAISSTTWSIIAVLIVAVFGLLGLVLKKRK